MEWLNILISGVVSLLTVIGGGSIFYVRSTRKTKEQEAIQAEQATQHAYVEEWKELYERKERKVEVLDGKLDEMRAKKNELEQTIAALRLENERLQWAKCTVNGCDNRQPPHYYDAKGNEVLPQCEHSCK